MAVYLAYIPAFYLAHILGCVLTYFLTLLPDLSSIYSDILSSINNFK